VEDEHVVHARLWHCFVEECLDLYLSVKIDSALYMASLELIRVSAVYYGHSVNGTVVLSVNDVRHLKMIIIHIILCCRRYENEH